LFFSNWFLSWLGNHYDPQVIKYHFSPRSGTHFPLYVVYNNNPQSAGIVKSYNTRLSSSGEMNKREDFLFIHQKFKR